MTTATKSKTVSKSTKVTVEKAPRKATPRADNAAAVARTHDTFNADQIRILRALSKAKAPISRTELKVAVGINGLYSGGWLKGLNELRDKKLIRISQPEEARGFTHEITALGRKAVEKAEKNAAA